MCSSAGDIEDITNCSKEIQSNINREFLKKCKKCSEKSIILLQKKDPFCKLCFSEYCDHKFRSTIGKSKKVKHGMRVLLACSGGRKSAALLNLTKQTLKSASFKQISFSPGILFIDENFLMTNTTNETPDVISILKDLKETEYDVLYSSLDMVYKLNNSSNLYSVVTDGFAACDVPCSDELRTKMKEDFKILTLSLKIDLLKHLKLLLITEIASQASYDCVFVGDTASSLAVDLLSDIALGRGSQISCDTSFYDTRYKVPVCRPLREFLNKEIALYNHFYSTVYRILPDFLTKTSPNSCIQRLTEEFLSNLQESFPATVFTVFRTGGKLSKTSLYLESRTCFLCKSEMDNKNSDPCSSLEALKISEKLSASTSQLMEVDNNSLEILQYFCHGCSINFKNMPKSHFFHSIVSEESLVTMERDKMKDEIKDFLLEENVDS